VTARRILYVQHAASLGGSTTSLLNTVKLLDRSRFEPVVALAKPSAELLDLYQRADVRTLPWPGIVTFEHTTLAWTALHRPLTWPMLAQAATGWRHALQRTRELVDTVKPDLVHLNSTVLVPSAQALRGGPVPFVWHVREGTPHGHAGVRTAWLRRALMTWPDEVIFLAEAERQSWVGGRRGVVVTNYVDPRRFERAPTREAARASLGLGAQTPVVLYVGGFGGVKGGSLLYEALARLRPRFPDLVCLMPGAIDQPSGRITSRLARRLLPLVGSGAPAQLALGHIARLGLDDVCRRLPFASDVERLFAASDVLVFPALEDHFARPVVEAAFSGLPSVATQLPTLAEQVVAGTTGLLAPADDASALADALGRLLADPALAKRMGAAARARARENNDAVRLVARITDIYDRLLDDRR